MQLYRMAKNAVKTQIWNALTAYVSVAIVKWRLKIRATVYEILKMLSRAMSEENHFGLVLCKKSAKKRERAQQNKFFFTNAWTLQELH